MLFKPDQGHSALLVRGDAPERIYFSTGDLTRDGRDWKASEPAEELRPERSWKGAGLRATPSYRSAITPR